MLRSYEAIYHHGQFKWLDDIPRVDNARVIVTIIEEIKPPLKKRQPSASIAGKGKTLGDIVSPIDEEVDWECLK